MPGTSGPGSFGTLRFEYGSGLLFFFAVAVYFPWQEHEAYILGYLPPIRLLGVCGGMHVVMHGGHGGGHGSRHDKSGEGDR